MSLSVCSWVCQSHYESVNPFMSLSIPSWVCQSVHECQSHYESASHTMSLSIPLWVCQSVHESVSPFMSLSVRSWVCQSHYWNASPSTISLLDIPQVCHLNQVNVMLCNMLLGLVFEIQFKIWSQLASCNITYIMYIVKNYETYTEEMVSLTAHALYLVLQLSQSTMMVKECF
jgi:hypothetical protein